MTERPLTQYEWMRRLSSETSLGTAVKSTGLTMGSYTSSDGTSLYVGAERLAGHLRKHVKRVRADRAVLFEAGWVVFDPKLSTESKPRYRLAVPTHASEPAWRDPVDWPDYWVPPKYISDEAERAAIWVPDEREAGEGWKPQWIKRFLQDHGPAFSNAEKLVGVALALDAEGDGTGAVGGLKFLKRATCLSQAGVRLALAVLRECGAAQRIISGQQSGIGLCDEYLLGDPAPAWLAARLTDRELAKAAEAKVKLHAAAVRRFG